MRKQMVRGGAGWLLCCVWSICMGATQAGQQIIFEGRVHAFGAVKSSGNDVPLLDALERIVPSSYSVNMPNAGTWAEMPVSWRPGAFTSVLGQVLAQDVTLQARVNTDLQLVTVSKKAIAGEAVPAHSIGRPPAPAPASMLAAKPAPLVPVAMHTSPGTVPLAAPLAPPPSTIDAAGVSMRVDLPASAAPAPDVPKQTQVPVPAATRALVPAMDADGATGAASPPMPVQTTWQLTRADGSIRNALSRWANEAGWQFVWDVPTDFSIDAAATLHGTLEDALNAVVNALSTSQVPIQIVMYKGNRVLRVVAKGAG